MLYLWYWLVSMDKNRINYSLALYRIDWLVEHFGAVKKAVNITLVSGIIVS